MTTNHRARLRAVALPTEHGGWSLTLEPAALGLLVAPSGAGGLLAAAALTAFLLRTPMGVVLVDLYRGRRLERTRLASAIAGIEAILLVGLVVLAASFAEGRWWGPLVPAAGLIALATWFDVRSKSRHLVPELAGTVGIAAIAAAIGLAGGAESLVAYGLWLLMAARAVAVVFFVRVQLRRAKAQRHRRWHSDAAQLLTTAAVVAGMLVDAVSAAAAIAFAVLSAAHLALVRANPPRAAVLGAQQVVFGLTLVLIAGLAAAAP